MRQPRNNGHFYLFWNYNEWAIRLKTIMHNASPHKLRAASKWFARAADYIEHQERKKLAKRAAKKAGRR